MKKIILFSFILLLVLPLSAYIDEKEGWKTTDTDNEYAFKVLFNGVEYSEIGFSKTMTTYSKGMGLTKNEYTNKSLTLTQTAHDASSYTYSTGDSKGYMYWYMSVCQAMTLYLNVESSIPAQNSITVNFKSYSYDWVTTEDKTEYKYTETEYKPGSPGSGSSVDYYIIYNGEYVKYSRNMYIDPRQYTFYTRTTVTTKGGTSFSPTNGDVTISVTPSGTTSTGTVSSTYGTVVCSVPACYAVVQGNSEFSVEAVVKEYPESRRIGTLKLTLVTT